MLERIKSTICTPFGPTHCSGLRGQDNSRLFWNLPLPPPKKISFSKQVTFNFVHNVALLTTYTGCFIMFSVITNIYNKKTKGPTLMELFTATGKIIFLTTRDVWCVHHGWHRTHRFDIQVLATHTRQHGCFLLAQTPSFSKLFISRTYCLVYRRVLSVLCTKCTLHSNHRLTVWYSKT